MEGFWGAVTSTAGVWVASGIIVAIGAGAFIYFLYQYRDLVRTVQRALAVVQADGPDGALADRLELVRDEMQRIPRFRDLWNTYVTHNLVVDAEGRVWRLAPAHSVFDSEEIIGRFVHTSLFAAVPGILTGLGLLGTFFGLVGGLSLAREGLTSQNLMDMVSSLRGLLGGASTAFWTSIVGLFTSVVFNVLYRGFLRSVRGKIVQFNETLDAISERSDAAIAVEGYFQLRKQSDLLAELRDGLIEAIHQQVVDLGQQFHSQVVEQLVPKFDHLADILERLVRNQAQLQHEQMTDLADRFQQAITATARGQLETLTQQLGAAAEQLKTVTTTLADGNELIQRGTAEAAQHLQQAVDSGLGLLQSQFDHFGSALREMLDGIHSTIGGLKDELRAGVTTFGHGLGRAAEEFGGIMERRATELQHSLGALLAAADRLRNNVDAATGQLKAVLRELGSAHQEIADSAKQVRSLSEAWSDLFETAKGLTNELRSASGEVVHATRQQEAVVNALSEAATTLRGQMDRMSRAWQEYRDRFEAVDRSLAGAVEQLVSGAAAFAEQVVKCVESLDKSFEKGSNYLSAAVGELRTVIEDMGEEVTQLREVLRPNRLPAGRQP